jgi:hypothetical protein
VDIAVVVNLRARRGSDSVTRGCRAELPDARIMASRSLGEAATFAEELRRSPPELLVSAGGDGTAVALINALRAPQSATAAASARPPGPILGVLPLGTGNGWARVTGAPRWRTALERIRRATTPAWLADVGPLPQRHFDLVEVGGSVAHFAGTGFDAELIEDFHAQKTGFGLLPERARNGLAGYLQGLVTRTIPRHLFGGELGEVELINTGDDAMTIDDAGRPIPLPGGGNGAVLYRGPVSVCAAGTTPEWGFGFRAFPFAGAVPRRFCMRVYGGTALEASLQARRLWRGDHPMPKMHTWMLTRCRAVFSRPMPFQIGGDRLGYRSEVEYALAADSVSLLDWRALAMAA